MKYHLFDVVDATGCSSTVYGIISFKTYAPVCQTTLSFMCQNPEIPILLYQIPSKNKDRAESYTLKMFIHDNNPLVACINLNSNFEMWPCNIEIEDSNNSFVPDSWNEILCFCKTTN